MGLKGHVRRIALLLVISGWAGTASAGLVHEYTFNGTTADSFGGPAMVLLNPSGLGADGYTFGPGEGPMVGGVMVGTLASHYAIEMSFSVGEVDDGYVKVIDFSNLQDDEGLYLYDDYVLFYDETEDDNIDLSEDTMIDLLVIRDDATNEFSVSVDGVEVLSFIDDSGYAVFGGHGQAYFFVDDWDTDGRENSSGYLDSIRIYDDAQGGGASEPIPEPGTLALLGLGAAAAGVAKRRRQKRAAA